MRTRHPEFTVITGEQVSDALTGREPDVVDLVRDTYLLHGDGRTVNPRSMFLRFPDRPSARIIALPASIAGSGGSGRGVDGIKWISSVPANVERGIPRASAVTILNDPVTGYPYACIESSIISATRTAASAALAAATLSEGRRRPTRLGIVGGGLISRYVHRYLEGTGWEFETISVHDTSRAHADDFAAHLGRVSTSAEIVVCDDVLELVRSSDLILFATVAPEPYVHDPGAFAHGPVVLNVSLRDLAPAVVLHAYNVVDDVDHVLTAGTSVHLTAQEVGHQDFIDATLAEVHRGRAVVPQQGPVIFSPFGLGVLDLAVAQHVYERLEAGGQLRHIDGFFHDMTRLGV